MKLKNLLPVPFIILVSAGLFFLWSQKGNTGISSPDNLPKNRLVLNTDKSEYILGEEVYVQIASLDTNGNALCDSNLEITVVNNDIPDSTFNIPVSASPACSPSGNPGNNPDYYAYFKPENNSQYQITLKNIDDGNSIQARISVGESSSGISVSRWGPARLNSNTPDRYPMIITVSADSGFKGTISDTLPAGFTFAWFGGARIKEGTISWDIDLDAGESTELKYEYIPGGNQVDCVIGPVSISSNGSSRDIGNIWNLTTYHL